MCQPAVISVTSDPPVRERATLKPCALDGASLISRMSFLWVYELLSHGSHMVESDLPGLPTAETSHVLFDELAVAWRREQQLRPNRPSLLRALTWRMLLPRHVWGFATAALEGTCHIAQALGLGALVSWLNESDARLEVGLAYAGWVVGCGLGAWFLHHVHFFIAWRYGLRMRVALVSHVMAKALRLSLGALHGVSVGHVVTLASSDVEKFQVYGIMTCFLVLAPLEALVVLAIGLRLVGLSFLAGFVLCLLLVPLQMHFSRRFGAIRRGVAAHSDRRVKLTSQVITGARLVKVCAWEHAMARLIG